MNNAPDFTRQFLFNKADEWGEPFERVLVAHKKVAANIDRDRNLTDGKDGGKATRKREIALASLDGLLTTWDPEIGRLEHDIEWNGGAITRREHRCRAREGEDLNDPRLVQIESEKRAAAAKLDQVERDVAYLEACRGDDRPTVRAMEQPGADLLSAETIREGAELQAAVQSPSAYQVLEGRRAQRMSLKCDLNRVRTELGLDTRPPVEQLIPGAA